MHNEVIYGKLCRHECTNEHTIGTFKLYRGSRLVFGCVTLEPPEGTFEDIKAFREGRLSKLCAIPTGTYLCRKEWFPPLERRLYTIQWDKVGPKMHEGVTVRDAWGCIIIGDGVDSRGRMRGSRRCLIRWHALMMYKMNPEFWLTIRNHF